MDKIQLIFFFISGFLVSRLIIKVRLPEKIVEFLIGEKHLSLSKILLHVLALSAVLSFFIPNAITVLTVLPVLEFLRQSFEETIEGKNSIATMLALAAIYGANIGGMGSITATPANGILVTYAELNAVPGKEYLTFASWLAWGIPLVIVLLLISWLLLIAVFRTWRYAPYPIHISSAIQEIAHPRQNLTLVITVAYFLSSLLLSVLIMQYPRHALEILLITGGITTGFILILFGLPLKHPGGRETLLVFRDCYSNLPLRGFLFVGLAIAAAGLLYILDIEVYFSRWVSTVIPTAIPQYLLFLFIALVTSFTTEILSNTAVQLSMFIIILPLSEAIHFAALPALLVITLSCTSAFMSPIATGVNGLAFGGVRGVSVLKMLLVGFFMNITGAVFISLWISTAVEWLYRLYMF